MKRLLFLPLLLLTALPALAQQKMGYVESDAILQALPEYAGVQQQLERQQQEWQTELQRRRDEVDRQFRDYQARELLYTQEERQRRREEITRAESEVNTLRTRYFGPEGELFTQQQALMRPLQERILAAIETVATTEAYDYVFDKGGDFLFLYRQAPARPHRPRAARTRRGAARRHPARPVHPSHRPAAGPRQQLNPLGAGPRRRLREARRERAAARFLLPIFRDHRPSVQAAALSLNILPTS